MSNKKEKQGKGVKITAAIATVAVFAVSGYIFFDDYLFKESVRMAEEGLGKHIAHLRTLIKGFEGKENELSKFPSMGIAVDPKPRPWYRLTPDVSYRVEFFQTGRVPLLKSTPKEFMGSLKSAKYHERFMDIYMWPRDRRTRENLLRYAKVQPNLIVNTNVNKVQFELQKLKQGGKLEERLNKFTMYDPAKRRAVTELATSAETSPLLVQPSPLVRPVPLQQPAPDFEPTPYLGKRFLRRSYTKVAAAEQDENIELTPARGGGGGGGYGVALPPRQGSIEDFRGVRRKWTKRQVIAKLRECGWEYWKQGSHPIYRYMGENPDLQGRTLRMINGSLDTQLTDNELRGVMSLAGYYN